MLEGRILHLHELVLDPGERLDLALERFLRVRARLVLAEGRTEIRELLDRVDDRVLLFRELERFQLRLDAPDFAFEARNEPVAILGRRPSTSNSCPVSTSCTRRPASSPRRQSSSPSTACGAAAATSAACPGRTPAVARARDRGMVRGGFVPA